MNWNHLPRNPTPRALRQFAAAWLFFFAVLGLYHWLARTQPRLGGALCLLAVVVGVPGLVKPALIRWTFVTSLVVTFPLGWLITQCVLGLMFYLVITPVALVFRLGGRDPLRRKSAPGRPSFWNAHEQPRDMRRYFRQY
jgi:hypothetical protein